MTDPAQGPTVENGQSGNPVEPVRATPGTSHRAAVGTFDAIPLVRTRFRCWGHPMNAALQGSNCGGQPMNVEMQCTRAVVRGGPVLLY